VRTRSCALSFEVPAPSFEWIVGRSYIGQQRRCGKLLPIMFVIGQPQRTIHFGGPLPLFLKGTTFALEGVELFWRMVARISLKDDVSRCVWRLKYLSLRTRRTTFSANDCV